MSLLAQFVYWSRDCPWPQSRAARLKPETMRVTFEEFSPTYDFFSHTSSGILDTLKPYSYSAKGYSFLTIALSTL